MREFLVEPNKLILPRLHIKLGLMKQFVKALDRGGDCFKYLGETFSGLSEEKLKGVFVGPDICRLMEERHSSPRCKTMKKSLGCL